MHSRPIGRTAFVLAGGGARGAYEVGVIQQALETLRLASGHAPLIEVFCGTSVGAINVSYLAAHAGNPVGRGAGLADVWRSMSLDAMLKPDGFGMLESLRSLLCMPRIPQKLPGGGAMLDAAPLRKLISDEIPFGRLREHLSSGRLHALTLSSTHIATGRTTLFAEVAGPLPAWRGDPTVVPHAVELGVEHAIASAAMPVVFPAMTVDGEQYCDGGLRQNVPLSPALWLGADRMLVVTPRSENPPKAAMSLEHEREEAFGSPVYLLGKTISALLFDRVDHDIDRAHHLNEILEAGTLVYGPHFLDALNKQLQRRGRHSLKPVRTVHIRPSVSIAALAAEYVRSATFSRRNRGLAARGLRRIADEEGTYEGDLTAFLMFDGEFAGRLIELGKEDARARTDDILRVFGTDPPLEDQALTA